MDIRAYNREAWNTEADKKNPWTIPVGPEVIAAARRGEWHLLLTPLKPVPREWYPLPPPCHFDERCPPMSFRRPQGGEILTSLPGSSPFPRRPPSRLPQDFSLRSK